MSAYVYIVECADGTLYTGWTDDVAKRVAAHNAGRGAKYTRSRRPVVLRYYEELEDKSSALSREAAIKRLSRAAKQQLIATAVIDNGGKSIYNDYFKDNEKEFILLLDCVGKYGLKAVDEAIKHIKEVCPSNISVDKIEFICTR